MRFIHICMQILYLNVLLYLFNHHTYHCNSTLNDLKGAIIDLGIISTVYCRLKSAYLIKKRSIIYFFYKMMGIRFGIKQLFQKCKYILCLCHFTYINYMFVLCLAKSRCSESALSSPVWWSQPSKPLVLEVSKLIVLLCVYWLNETCIVSVLFAMCVSLYVALSYTV